MKPANTRIATLAIVAASLLSHTASAAPGVLNNAKITQIRIDDTGLAIIYFNENLTGARNGCVHAGFLNALAINTTTTQGRSQLSVITSAFLSGRSVDVLGKDACNHYTANVEDLQNLTLK